jgi:hypothetical protein
VVEEEGEVYGLGLLKDDQGAPSTLRPTRFRNMARIQEHQSRLVALHARARRKSGAAEAGMPPLVPEHEHGIVMRIAQLGRSC